MKGLLALVGSVFLATPENGRILYKTVTDALEMFGDVCEASSGILERYLELRDRLACRKTKL